jgi:hypothetical protein
MKKILAILILAGALAPLHAQDNGALWKSTLAQLDASRKWAAGEIETISDVEKGGALKHEVSSMRLRGWEKGKPAYALVRQEPPDEKKSAAASPCTRYTTGAQGQPLAGMIDYAFEILMPFRHSKARIKQTNSGWVARPAE